MIISINKKSDRLNANEYVEVRVAGGFEPQAVKIDTGKYIKCFKPAVAGVIIDGGGTPISVVGEEAVLNTTVDTDKHPGLPHIHELLKLASEQGLEITQFIKGEAEEIQIESNLPECLALPWEDVDSVIKERSIFLSRKIQRPSGFKPTANQNVLIATSDAYIDELYGGMSSISDDFPEEVSAITRAIYANHNGQPLGITLYRHIGRVDFEAFDKSEYGIIHIMMHGEKSRLGFEGAGDNKYLDWVDKEEFAGFCSSNKAKLFFLSACDSAYGEKELSSLAQLLIEKGLTEYAIGFNWRMGSTKTLPAFANAFYASYFDSGDIETGFRQAVGLLIRERSPYWSRPTLYIGAKL